MTTFTMRCGDELYVFVHGWLIMKRWLKTGVSVTFDHATYWNHG
jgi:hypothetical protein